MTLITLNGMNVHAIINSFASLSQVTPLVASSLKNLDAVNICCCPIQDVVSFSCFLDLKVCEELEVDCVLGRDFFSYISNVICPPHRRFLNDNVNLMFIIEIFGVLLDQSSLLYCNNIVSDDIKTLLTSHGLTVDNCSLPDSRRAFFHHVLNGMCPYTQDGSCHLASHLSPSQISHAAFAFVSCAPLTVLRIACQSLGNFINFDHQSRTPNDILREYEIKLGSYTCSSAQDSFFELISSSSSHLLLFSAAHGLSVSGDLTSLRSVLIRHICYGGCFKMESFFIPVGCKLIRSEFTTRNQIPNSDEFMAFFLEKVGRTLHRKQLCLVLDSYEIKYDSQWSLSQLRNFVQSIVCNLRDGDESMDSSDDFPSSFSTDFLHRRDAIQQTWPQMLTMKSKLALIQDFRHETSSTTLQLFTCACCGENIFRTECEEISIKNIDLNLFKSLSDHLPMQTPFSSGIFKDLLLCPAGIHDCSSTEISFILCLTCWSSLRRGKVPSLALANDTYLGDVPFQLQDLTFVEELMIGLCRAKCSIFQLTENKSSPVSPVNQTAFRGHIIIYPQNPSSIASILPPPVEEITSLICVLFIGSSKPTLKWLHERAKPLAVRANKVRDALIWLKKNNNLYHHITINEAVISELPQNGILPFHIEHMTCSQNQDSLTSSYEKLRNEHNNETNQRNSDDSISFEKLIITDVEGHTSSNDLRIAALNHVQKKGGAFLTVPHANQPENEFGNPSLFPKMYPTLFPYGVGGIEDDNRKYKISFQYHIKHLLKLNDKRFQRHPSFSFVAFNMLQRRTVLLRTHLRMKRSGFSSTAQIYDTITPDSINHMIERMSKDGISTSYDEIDRPVHQLMRDVRVINSHVPGSSAARLQMRNEIRALTTHLGVPSFFVTINPADVYSPILKFLALQNFDIDKLESSDVPNYWEQASLIAHNPSIAATFFDVFMKAFIKTLLKFDSQLQNDEGGVLGHVKGYYGCVEAQGRGSLHCHMLIWIEGSLNPDDLKTKLLSDTDFNSKIVAYLEDTISTCVPSKIDNIDTIPSCEYDPVCIRGMNKGIDYIPNFEEYQSDLHYLVERCQRHIHNATCFKYWKGPPEPKQCRFELDDNNVVLHTMIDDISGDITYQHLDGLLNNFNGPIIEALRCNMDIKFIGSGVSAKAILYYITDYIAKHQLKSHVAYSLIEGAIRKLDSMERENDDIKKRGKQLLQKCAHALVSQQELSSQQVSSYLLDYGDHYTSHTFKPLYWTMFEAHINKQPSGQLQDDDFHLPHTDNTNNSQATDLESIDNDDEIRISVNDDKLIIDASQQMDYIYRAKELDLMNLWDFIAQTEKTKGDFMYCNTKNLSYDHTTLFSTTKSRPTYPFMSQHDQHLTHVLKIKHPDRRCVPTLIGSPPRADREDQHEKYARFILILFKPWKEIIHLRNKDQNWSSALNNFLHSEHCKENHHHMMKNMRLLHESKDCHDYDFMNRIQRRRQSHLQTDLHSDSMEPSSMDDTDESLSIIQYLNTIETCFSNKNLSMKTNVADCITYAKNAGMFAISDQIQSVDGNMQCIDLNNNNFSNHETEWKNEYDTRKKNWKIKTSLNSSPDTLHNLSENNSLSYMIPESNINSLTSSNHNRMPQSHLQSLSTSSSAERNIPHREDAESIAQKWTLNPEQLKAFWIIVDHVLSQSTTPLRMFLNGPAGTGKSRVINAVKEFFDKRGEERKFRLASYMGIAARNINGMTLHQLLGLNTRKSAKKNQELKSLWEGVQYLFIDEISMIGCIFLNKISETLCHATGDTRPFGGLSVIFAGDFAQLPPVKTTRLYAHIDTRKREQTSTFQETVAGKMLWLSVNTIIQLTHLHRQQGSENLLFQDLLSRMREGRCTTSDFEMLNTRVLSPTFNVDFSRPPWQNAPVVVYDNATKDSLNNTAAEAFARQTGQELHWYYASDFYKKKPIEDDDLINSLQDLHSGETNQRLTRLPLVLGMPVLISHNFSVNDGVVNGARGVVKDIRFSVDEHGRRHLLSVVVHIPDSSPDSFPNLSSHDYPILPDSTDFQLTHPYNHTKISILRHQVPLQPAFAMTAHRSQGQTLPRATIDYQSCKGTEAPYVMTSRVRSLNDLVILRPFDHKKICCHASEDYRIEQRRLSILASQCESQSSSKLSVDISNTDIHDQSSLANTQFEIHRLTNIDDSNTSHIKHSSIDDEKEYPSKRSKI